MLNLTPAERSVLRAEAHGLKPIVLVGESGLTPAVMKEIELGLDSHGLIKVRVFGDDREARVEMYETICEKTGAAPRKRAFARARPTSSKRSTTSTSC